MTRVARLLTGLAGFLLAGCDATTEGRAAYVAGRPADAWSAWRRAAAEAGDGASPELSYDLALAALAVGELDAAEQAARRAAERGGAAFEPLRDFVLGNVSFARSLEAEAAAQRPAPDAAAWERAATHAEDALARWRLAAASRADWPQARRNVERALLRLDRLRERRRDGGGPQRTPVPLPGAPGSPDGAPPGTPPFPPPPEPPATPDPGGSPPAAGATVESGRLDEAQVGRLFEVLLEKERRKQALRRAARLAPTPGVERDW